MKKHEVIIVGGGHNGLTCAAYLARSGVDVLVLEQRHIAGGPCAEYEFFPGYRASMSNSPGSLEPKIVADLELERFGLTFTRPNPTLMFPFPDGRAFVGFREPERVAAQIRQFSEKDVDGYPALFNFLNRFAERLGVSIFEPPPTMRELGARLKTPEDEEAFAKVFLGSVADLLGEYLESPCLKAPVAQLGVVSNWVGPFSPGSASWLLARPMSLASSRIDVASRPASAGAPRIHRVAARRHGQHRAHHPPVAGGGGRLGPHRCESGADPRQRRGGRSAWCSRTASSWMPTSWYRTSIRGRPFSSWVEPDRLDSDFRARVSALPKKGFTFKFALSLEALPHFAASPKGLERECAGCQFRIAPSIEYQERAFDDAKYGRCAQRPTFWGLFPSVADPSLAPAGQARSKRQRLSRAHRPRRGQLGYGA